MKLKTIATVLVATTLAGCGGVYRISRVPGYEGTRADFQRDELICNQHNFFVFAAPTDTKQTIYMTKHFRECMKEKGWKYSLYERKFWPTKPAGLQELPPPQATPR
jgi:hypothetical protein